MNHILDLSSQESELVEIFKKIQEGNSILFLGAGASVGEKKYLSKQIIEFYEEKINKHINESNITKWVDILSADPEFKRSHFDDFVYNLLKTLKSTEAHEILATIPWREIITTNYDLLVEQAFDSILNTSNKMYDIKVIRNLQQYNYMQSNTEVKYIKLNGCIQDKKMYPLAFSSNDFDRIRSFYKLVLNDLKNLSPSISFISIGYSYMDDFGKKLLEKFDSYNYRDKRWMINVDPYPNTGALAYYAQQKIQIVKCSFEEFFKKYKDWKEQNNILITQKKGLSIRSSNALQMNVPNNLLLNLDGIVRQLDIQTKQSYIKEEEFYRGEEPNFDLIVREVDVVKTKTINICKHKILNALQNKETFLPIFFIIGDFGIGKSTFSLRLIYELEKIEKIDLISFEIIDLNRIRKEDLTDLVKYCTAKNIIFYCDEIEIESYYKSLIELRLNLSIEQFQDCNILFIAPIRENIYEKFKLDKKSPNSHELKITGSFDDPEIDELLLKLRNSGIVEYRDEYEKNIIKNKIKVNYNSDSFISLMSIVSNGRHEAHLIRCYNELSKEAQTAFLYTALLHKHKLLMPIAWLKQIISMGWDDFESKVIKAEGKGILIQEIRTSHGTQPDLYFRTKHPLIAQKLVEKFMPSKDKQFKAYEKMLRLVESGVTNSYIVNNLLKTFIRNDVFNREQIDKLFIAANTKLSDDPYFLLNYAINLQHKRNQDSIKKAIQLLLYAESLFEHRNHKFIHRRAVLNFELAKLYSFKNESLSLFYLEESFSLFQTKQLMDPCSSYSYVEYIKALIWQLNKIDMDNEDKMRVQIKIEWLLDYAHSTVTIDFDRINACYTEYANYLDKMVQSIDYEAYLYNMYEDDRLRPYACILYFNYYKKLKQYEKCDDLIEEIEGFMDNYEVVKFLFNYYGDYLYSSIDRQKLISIANENCNLEEDMPFKFNYFYFIAETYNGHYNEGKKYLDNIKRKYNITPSFHYVWCDPDGVEKIFDAKIRKGYRYKEIKISSLQLKVRLAKGDYEKYPIGMSVKVKLHFYLYGLIAEII